jgi:hypothetical protein
MAVLVIIVGLVGRWLFADPFPGLSHDVFRLEPGLFAKSLDVPADHHPASNRGDGAFSDGRCD